MTVRYIIDADPGHAAALTRVMGGIGIRFDPQENLCAMPRENWMEQIYQGNDVEFLVEKANEYLEEVAEHPLRFRPDLEEMDDLQGIYDFLMLMTMGSDWYDLQKGINEINAGRLEEFGQRHPLAMHPAGEEPDELPVRRRQPTDLDAPLFPHPTLRDLLRETLRLAEQDMALNTGQREPDQDDPVTDIDLVTREVEGLRHILSGLHDDWSPRGHMQDQFGDQLHSGARLVLELLDAEDRDRLDEVVGQSLRECQARKR